MSTDAETTVAVAEQFYSVQGEGRYMGTPAVFLRTATCNLLCGGKAAAQDYQDTAYEARTAAMRDAVAPEEGTWVCDTIAEWMDGNRRTAADLYADWDANGWTDRLDDGAHVVVTGGEPVLQQAGITAFLDRLDEHGHDPYVELETNATKYPALELRRHVDQYNLSSKLSNSGNLREHRYQPDVLATYVDEHIRGDRANADFKMVVGAEEDWAEFQTDFVDPFEIPKDNIYLMPAGAADEDLALAREDVVELAKDHAVQYSDRLQIVVWDQATGV